MITSTSNAKIKHVSQLLTSSKLRREERVFVVEGERMVKEIPPSRVRECYVAESFTNRSVIPQGVEYEDVSDVVFKKMSDTMTPQGILCVVSYENLSVDSFLADHKEGSLKLLVLEAVQDPGNLGTMVRTAEGAGFDGIIADNKTADLYNPKVIRSTMGSIFRVPVMYTEDIYGVIGILKENNVKVCAAHLKGECYYHEADYTNRAAVLIGNEGNGLSERISSLSDLKVKIPMEGNVESLNAAIAAALMMYEIRKG